MSVRLQACVWTATASTRRGPSAASVWPGWQWAWMDASVLVSQCFVSRNGLCAHFGFMANCNLAPVSVENQYALKAATRNFCFLLILAPRGQNRCEHRHLLLKRSRSEIIFNTIFRLKLLQWTFLFFVDSGGPYKQNVRQIWGWNRVNFVLVQYHKTAEQLLSSGCEK